MLLPKKSATLFDLGSIKYRKAKHSLRAEKERVVMMKLENENKLTNAELEQVAGGGTWEAQIAQDSRFLNVLLRGREGHCGRYGTWQAPIHSDEIKRAWASVGVDYILHTPNKGYYIHGRCVSQYEAWLHAEQMVGKHLKRADWDW